MRMDSSPLKKGTQIVRCDVEIIIRFHILEILLALSNEPLISRLNVAQHIQLNAAYQGEHIIHSDGTEVITPCTSVLRHSTCRLQEVSAGFMFSLIL